MRRFLVPYLPLLLLVVAPALGQSGPRVQFSHTTENLRGVSAVSRQVAWASGTHRTYLRTIDGGRTWTPAQVTDLEKGRLYVQLASEKAPDGNLRGWLLSSEGRK